MLGNQIRNIRKANKVSQIELARMLGVSKQSVSNWENNNILPSIAVLRKICKTFSCSADYLLELDKENSLKIDTSRLTLEQATHIQHLVEDIATLNETQGKIKDE